MDAKKLFGLRRTSDAKGWLWYLDPENYRPILASLDLDESRYLEAWSQVHRAFPFEWAQGVARSQRGGVGWSGLLPPHLGRLAHHPIAFFLAHRPYGWATAAPLVRLGIDLYRVKDIPGAVSVVRDLRRLDQYVGRLFELHALSTLQAAGWRPSIVGTPDFQFTIDNTPFLAEARHRGAPLGMAVFSHVFPPVSAQWHHIKVHLESIDVTEEKAPVVAQQINTAIADLLTTPEGFGERIGTHFRVVHDDKGDARTISFSYGSPGPLSAELGFLTYRTLREKVRQLSQGPVDHRKVVLLDCRSLVRSIDRDQVLRDAVLAGGERFLQEERSITGIIWWWPHRKAAVSLRAMIHEPDAISVSVRGSHREGLSAETLLNAAWQG